MKTNNNSGGSGGISSSSTINSSKSRKGTDPLPRGSHSHAKSIREVLELEMKKKEGWLVPRLLTFNSLLLCIISIILY